MTDFASTLSATLFNVDEFSETGKAIIDLLAKNLQQSLSQSHSVMAWSPPQQANLAWQMHIPQTSAMSTQQWLHFIEHTVLAKELHIHHPRNMGHQVATPLPLTALCDVIAALTNQAMAVYETGPIATLIEHQLIRWCCELVGFGQGASGLLTSGGAQANLTALLAARQRFFARQKLDTWRMGLFEQTPPRILVSAHAHYSISRAAGIMGLGTKHIEAIPCDPLGRLSIPHLESTLAALQARQIPIMAVVACAGCTPTGSIDPIEDIAALCKKHQLWLHVDGAHGAALLHSEHRRQDLRGIEHADSVVWDGHKLGYLPATVSAVLFKHTEDSFAAFAQEASYLFQGETHQDEFYNQSYRTLECTKRMMGLKWWTAFMLYGAQTLGALVEHVNQRAQQMAGLIQARPSFVLLMPPALNIVCFGLYLPQYALATQNAIHQAIRQQLVQSGQFHLTQTQLDGKVWLRTTLMNPMTTEADLVALLDAIENTFKHVDVASLSGR